MIPLILGVLVVLLVVTTVLELRSGKDWLDVLGSRALLFGIIGMLGGGALFEAGLANTVSMTSMLLAIPAHFAWSRRAARVALEQRLEASRKRMMRLAESSTGGSEGTADLYLAFQDEIDGAAATQGGTRSFIRSLAPAGAVALTALFLGSWPLVVGAGALGAWTWLRSRRKSALGLDEPLEQLLEPAGGGGVLARPPSTSTKACPAPPADGA
jgi:hypothetical protein